MAQAHQQFSKAAILRLTKPRFLLVSRQVLQLPAHFAHDLGLSFAISHAQPFRLPLRFAALLIPLVEQKHYFVLELLKGFVQSSELGELCLGIGKTAFQVLDLPRLLAEFTRLPLHQLLQLGDPSPLAAQFLVQPVDHLSQLCCVHVLHPYVN